MNANEPPEITYQFLASKVVARGHTAVKEVGRAIRYTLYARILVSIAFALVTLWLVLFPL